MSFSQNNNAISKAQKYLIENKLDSLNLVLKNSSNKKEKIYLLNISSHTASFTDYFELISAFTTTDKSSVSKLNWFIDKRLKQPTASNKLNLKYVKVRWFQISNLLDIEELNEAAKISRNLNDYIFQFKSTNGVVYKKAKIYARIYPIVLYLIKKKGQRRKTIMHIK